MNESLRRALLRARLSEEDVAARLQVDPKTVRRWLEGRAPYPRHRWALASLLGLEDIDLWPRRSTDRSWPREVQAIYPHRDDVPRDTWRSLFAKAKRKIDILAATGLFFGEDLESLTLICQRARVGVPVRICLSNPSMADHPQLQGWSRILTSASPDTRAAYQDLTKTSGIEIRLHRTTLTNLIYCCDDYCMIVQRSHGVPDHRCPVLHLRRDNSGDLVIAYSDCFERIWTEARPVSG